MLSNKLLFGKILMLVYTKCIQEASKFWRVVLISSPCTHLDDLMLWSIYLATCLNENVFLATIICAYKKGKLAQHHIWYVYCDRLAWSNELYHLVPSVRALLLERIFARLIGQLMNFWYDEKNFVQVWVGVSYPREILLPLFNFTNICCTHSHAFCSFAQAILGS
jgi:hypothetical protein